jgi:hypothetical protein
MMAVRRHEEKRVGLRRSTPEQIVRIQCVSAD